MALSGPANWWYGWVTVLGGVLFAASDFAARLVDSLDRPGASMGGYALWAILSLLALALLQVALHGLYNPHRQSVGTLGRVGFFLTSAGIAFAIFIVLVYAVVASPLPPNDPELLEAGPPAMFVLYFPLFSTGWILLGMAFLRIPFYPRWAIRLLGLGAVIALHPNPLTTVVFGAAVAWLGLALLLDGPPPEELPRRHPLPRSEGCDIAQHEPLGEISAPVYFFVGKRTDMGLTFLSQRARDGQRAVLAFKEAEVAEAFRIIEGLAPEWEVADALPEVVGLLRSAAREDVRYVVVNPPSALRRGGKEARLIPIMTFVNHLMGK